MTKTHLQHRAHTLRKQGKSIGDIAQKLGVSKGSVSAWCRTIKISLRQKKKLEKEKNIRNKKILQRFAHNRHLYRLQRTKELHALGLKDVGALTKREFFLTGLALYWGEGYKGGSGEVGFTYTSPFAIRFFITWVRDVYSIPIQYLTARITVNSTHQHREAAIRRYWSKITKIPTSAFTKTSFIHTRTQKKYPTQKTYYGTLRVKVRRSTDLQRRILGSLDGLMNL